MLMNRLSFRMDGPSQCLSLAVYLHTCQPRETFWRDKGGATERSEPTFNFQKCKCLHAGHGNTGVNYEMGGTILCKTVKEKDLG